MDENYDGMARCNCVRDLRGERGWTIGDIFGAANYEVILVCSGWRDFVEYCSLLFHHLIRHGNLDIWSSYLETVSNLRFCRDRRTRFGSRVLEQLRTMNAGQRGLRLRSRFRDSEPRLFLHLHNRRARL